MSTAAWQRSHPRLKEALVTLCTQNQTEADSGDAEHQSINPAWLALQYVDRRTVEGVVSTASVNLVVAPGSSYLLVGCLVVGAARQRLQQQ
jgi:hypothetical protein